MEDNHLDRILAEEDLAYDRNLNDKHELIFDDVNTWLYQAHGEFRLSEITKDLDLTTSLDIKEVKWILSTLCDEGKIKENKKKNGCYKKLSIELTKMKRVEDRVPQLDIKWPLNLHEKVVIYPGSLIILAAISNGGKSCFLLNFTEMNMDKHKIRYVSSEWTNSERDVQLEAFHANIDEWDSKIDFYAKKDVTSSFDNYIDPEKINIIDYYEKYDNYGDIPGDLRDIADKLTTGVAIVAMQKKAGMTHGYGGEGTVNRSQLYINIDRNELDPRRRIATIRKLKNATDRKYSIEHLSCEFEFNDKGRIVEQTDWGKIVEMKKKGVLMEKYVQAESWANQKTKKEDDFSWD
jgi:hypothetical protein